MNQRNVAYDVDDCSCSGIRLLKLSGDARLVEKDRSLAFLFLSEHYIDAKCGY